MPAAATTAMMLVCADIATEANSNFKCGRAQLKLSTFSFSLALSYCLFARNRSRLICMECDIFHVDRK